MPRARAKPGRQIPLAVAGGEDRRAVEERAAQQRRDHQHQQQRREVRVPPNPVQGAPLNPPQPPLPRAGEGEQAGPQSPSPAGRGLG